MYNTRIYHVFVLFCIIFSIAVGVIWAVYYVLYVLLFIMYNTGLYYAQVSKLVSKLLVS